MALPDAPISIYRIPNPAPLEDVTRYSHIRLSALKTNPEAFSSTFEEAAKYAQQQWSERVNTDGRTTLAARRGGSDATEDGHEEWLGTLSVLHPRMLRPMTGVFPLIPRIGDAVAREEIDRYLLVGMWVHPSARKTGVGEKLIQAALDIIKDEAGVPSKMVFLEVHTENAVARGLYSKMGFMEETECEGRLPHMLGVHASANAQLEVEMLDAAMSVTLGSVVVELPVAARVRELAFELNRRSEAVVDA